ncbi:MAG: phosphorylase, partial [Chloroflexi bacterium]
MKARVLLLVFILNAFTVSCQKNPVANTSADQPERLIVMTAFDAEMEALRAQAQIEDRQVINGRTFFVGKLAGKDVVLVQSGESMVNAAMTTQAALDHFPASGIVFSGIAGGVNPGLNIGDVVAPAQWGQYQEQLFARQTEEGWQAGQGEFGNFGMMFPQPVS